MYIFLVGHSISCTVAVSTRTSGPDDQFCQKQLTLPVIHNIPLDAQTLAMAIHQISTETNLLESLGFTLNQNSAFIPSQSLKFLRFQVDTLTMSLSLSSDKAQKIRKECNVVTAFVCQ